MTLAEIHQRIATIRSSVNDPEAAHDEEDDLWRRVLEAIASGEHEGSPQDLARAALQSREINFPRWCA